MAAKSTRGLKIYFEKDNASHVIKDAASGSLTDIADNAGKTELTVDAVACIIQGTLVSFKDSGFEELDGNNFIVESATGTTITINFDISGSSGAFDATNAVATFLAVAEMEALCASAVNVTTTSPSTISVGTFCSPEDSLIDPVVPAPTLELTVYHEPQEAWFQLLESALQSGDTKLLAIVFPADGGTLVAEGNIGAFTLSDLPISGAAAWTATLSMGGRPQIRI